jgi:hypothetical protein
MARWRNRLDLRGPLAGPNRADARRRTLRILMAVLADRSEVVNDKPNVIGIFQSVLASAYPTTLTAVQPPIDRAPTTMRSATVRVS